jgi:hypothetical protein
MNKPRLNRIAGTALAAVLAAFAAAPSLASQSEVTPPAYAADGTTATADEPFALVGGDYGSQGFHHGLPETSVAPKTEPVAGDVLPD